MEGGFRSLGAPGLGAHQATQTILDLLDGRAGLTVHQVGPGRVNVSASRRPGWALVACLATFWIAGLGLFFLLVRRTETGEITVTDGPRGCVVILPPLVDGATAAALGDALAPTGAGVPAPPTAGSPAGELDDRTVARSEAHALLPPPPDAPAPPAPGPSAPITVATVELRFEDGTVVVEAGQPVVLGRDPSPVAGSVVRTVPGDASTISKSHLRAAFDGQVLTVEDLGSTNGSRVRRSGGSEASSEVLDPGTPVVVGPDDVVSMGARSFTAGPERPPGAVPPPLACTAMGSGDL